MAKKAELLEQAKKLKLEVTEKNTIVEIEEAINNATASTEKAVESKSKADDKEQAKLAKAGKRSAKGIAEAEEKAAKEERKANADTESKDEESVTKPKIIEKRKPRIERAGRNYKKAAELVDKKTEYGLKEALDLAVKTSTTKFDSTVEMHIRLNVDAKHADQNIREVLVLPSGNGKTVRIAVFAEADDVATAKKAGADVAGSEEFLQQLDKGIIDFDVLIATPSVMAKLSKYARILGPKGLMPNPKSGTVTTEITKAIEQARAGKVELRVDENGIVHLGIGKVSFGTEKLLTNAQAVFSSIKNAKPASVKGNYVISIYSTTTMGPSIKIQNTEV